MNSVLPSKPSKVIAVHLNYRSRAAERGRVPSQPSYFLKPPSTLSASGEPVVRPQGCELLAFEGEIALVIGRRTHGVAPAEAWGHVGWVTAANDFGIYDLRYADQGSNLRSKGVDGYTPLGPALLEAGEIDPADLRIRTWVNGRLVQEAGTGEELLFGFDLLVADLSRLMTLEAGDVILTGTPTGSTVVVPGDLVEVEVSAGEGAGRSAGEGAVLTTGRLRSPIVAAGEPLAAWGAMPKMDAAARDAALGAAGGVGRETLEDRYGKEVATGLGSVATATLASQLHQRGVDGTAMDGLQALRPELRLVGRAHTLRYLPLREDLVASMSRGFNAQKRGIEQVQPGDVVIIDCGGRSDAGTVGDILGLRAKVRGAAGIITDGAIRDSAALSALDLPLYHRGVHSAVLGRRHIAWESGTAVACAGVTVRPGDLVVGDGDGVVVIPESMVGEVVLAAVEQERQERFISEQVAKGAGIDGLYPLGEAWRQRYDEWARTEASGE